MDLVHRVLKILLTFYLKGEINVSDFISKAKSENDFNNGGSTLGTPGGGTAGPQTQLSNQNQEGVVAALEANVDTAQTNQIGATAAGNQNRAFSSANQPCNSPRQKPTFILDINSVGFGGDCGCYIDLGISLLTFLGLSTIVTKYAPKTGDIGEAFINYFGLKSLYLKKAGDYADGLFRNHIADVIGYKNIGTLLSLEAGYRQAKIAYHNKRISKADFEAIANRWKGTKLSNGQTAQELYDSALSARDSWLTVNTGLFVSDIINEVSIAVGGLTFAALISLGISRKKRCFGKNTTLNPKTCECECIQQDLEICPATQNSGSQLLFGWIVPGLLPQLSELNSCGPSCCGGQAKYQFGSDPCQCACLGEITFGTVLSGGGSQDDYWKQGNGCGCLRPGIFYSTRGKCISRFVEERNTALGQVWDADKCEFICPNTGKPEGERCIPDETYPVSVTYVDSNGVSRTEDSLCYCSPYLDCETSANCYVGSMCECTHFSDTHCYCEYSPNAEYECNTRVYLGDCNAPCPDPAPGLELCGVTAYGVCCDGQLRDTIADGPCPSCS